MLNYNNMNELVGCKILKAFIDKNRDGTVYLQTEGGPIRLEPEGDCCARAFLNGVTLANALVDAEVTSIENLETTQAGREAEDVYDHDVVDIWGHRIHTTKGTCTFDMRTHHNGYYSGWLNVNRVQSIPAGLPELEDF